MDGPRPVFEVISATNMPEGMGISQQPDGTLLCAMTNSAWATPVTYVPVRPTTQASPAIEPTKVDNISAVPTAAV